MSYINIVQHYEECFERFGDNSKGVDWPNETDAKTRYRIMMDLINYDQKIIGNSGTEISILDFGCGLGHLYEYIKENNIHLTYTGLDLSPVFIEKCREKYPDAEFIIEDIMKDNRTLLSKKYDYVVMNGVFTEKRELIFEEMFEYLKKMVIKVYGICNRGVAFNVMSKDVDWERNDLFHLPLNTLSSFLTKEVTRDFIIRYDYGLYEYTVYVYRR